MKEEESLPGAEEIEDEEETLKDYQDYLDNLTRKEQPSC